MMRAVPKVTRQSAMATGSKLPAGSHPLGHLTITINGMLSASTRTTTPQNQGFVLKSQRSFTASKTPIRQTQTPRPKSCFPTCIKMKKTGSSAKPIITPLQSVGFCGSGFSVCSNISSNQSIDRILYVGRSWKIGSLDGLLPPRTFGDPSPPERTEGRISGRGRIARHASQSRPVSSLRVTRHGQ